MKRLPVAVLIAAAQLSKTAFRDRVGTTTTVLAQAGEQGITPERANLWCEKLGLHPAEVYGATAWVRAVLGGEGRV